MAKRKKAENSTGTRKKTVYELIGETSRPLRRGVDPLDDLLLDEERELTREVKRIRLEEIVLRKRRERDRLRDGGGDMGLGPLPSNTDMMNLAKFIAELSPEEASRVRNAYSFLKLSEKGGGGGLNVLPMLLNYARSNPGSSEGQMVAYLKIMDSQLNRGIDLARTMNPAQSEDSTLKFLQLMKDLVIEGVRNPVLQAIEKAQPRPSAFEEILMNPDMFTRFTGMFGNGGGTKGQIDLEIEKLRGERQFQVTKMELEMRRDELKRQAEDRRTENLISVFAPFAGALAGAGSERMRALGQQHGAHNPVGPVILPQIPSVQLMCSCGYEGAVPVTDPPQTSIACPACGVGLQVKMPDGSPVEDDM